MPPPTPKGEPAWLHSHSHEPNPAPANTDTSFKVIQSDGTFAILTEGDLAKMHRQSLPNCTIFSTGHSPSGPFHFEGVSLHELLNACTVASYSYVDVVSADNFGTRILAEEITPDQAPPILLATLCDGEPLTRAQGAVRLIVPHEADDALRQVKWIARIEIH